MTGVPAKRGWLDVAEVGSVWGIRFVVGVCKLFGRGAARAVLRVIVFYYVLIHRTARSASALYLERVRARAASRDDSAPAPVGFRDVYDHFCTFADVALDRLLIASGQRALFEVGTNGREHLQALTEQKRGALLLGAHLGSFEAMRLGASTSAFPINMVVNFSNAQRMQSVLEQLDPTAATRLIPISGQTLDFVLRIRECIERGEMVAILADRVGHDARSTVVNFLGRPARFASGPFILAAALHCPVYLTFGLFRGGNRYDLFCEHFADVIELPRKRRDEALVEVVQRYADRLESYVLRAPNNWFNFYDFWSQS